MSLPFYFGFPFKQAVYDDSDLGIPLAHLFGNKIAISVLNGSQIDVSAWRPSNERASSYAGRIHISPLEFGADADKTTELVLIEDIILPDKALDNFPRVGERTTSYNLVNVSLSYSDPFALWNFQIHLRHSGKIEEEDFEIYRQERLSCFVHPHRFQKI